MELDSTYSSQQNLASASSVNISKSILREVNGGIEVLKMDRREGEKNKLWSFKSV